MLYRRLGRYILIPVLLIIALFVLVVLFEIHHRSSDEPQNPITENTKTSTDGPVRDLPIGWTSYSFHDRTNHSWYLITNDMAAVVIPQLDYDGNQAVIPQA